MALCFIVSSVVSLLGNCLPRTVWPPSFKSCRMFTHGRLNTLAGGSGGRLPNVDKRSVSQMSERRSSKYIIDFPEFLSDNKWRITMT
jgi:hypothetical protein